LRCRLLTVTARGNEERRYSDEIDPKMRPRLTLGGTHSCHATLTRAAPKGNRRISMRGCDTSPRRGSPPRDILEHRPMRASLLPVLVALAFAAGCAHVPAYDRGRLAHPTMLPEYSQSAGRAHMQVVQEGATGGDANPASGCGCN
jgi:hypothetical protein